MKWYYADKGQQIGPLDAAAFENLVSTGQIQPTTLVWNSGMTDWKPVSALSLAPPPLGAGAPAAHCSECGGRFGADDMIQYGDVWVCANCKPRFTQKLREGVSLAPARHYGGFWIRVLAVFIDAIVVSVVMFAMGLGFGLSWAVSFTTPGAWTGIAHLLALVYNVWFTSRYGGTVGKLLLGMRVITVQGRNLSILHAIGRYFANLLSSVILGIGYLMAAFDDEKRTLHDRICNTRVVKI